LAEVKPDGVVIATPNHLHLAHAELCIDAGIPVLIEKPIADTLEKADRIATLSEAAGVPVLIGHHRRHNPIVARAKEVVQAGTLGEIVAVNGQFWLYKPDDYFEATWRKGPGAGPALINFIHDVDLLRHFCGDLVEVQAMRSNAQRGTAVEDTAAILLRFANGALGTFSMSDTVVAPYSWEMSSGENPIYPHHPGACYTLGGAEASLSIPDLRLWRHTGARSWWNPIEAEQLSVTPADAFARQFAHFLDVIDGAAPRVSAREGRASLAAVLDVLQAGLIGEAQ
jgi:predicted dehydrogenase